jgi:hypothetical protein
MDAEPISPLHDLDPAVVAELTGYLEKILSMLKTPF